MSCTASFHVARRPASMCLKEAADCPCNAESATWACCQSGHCMPNRCCCGSKGGLLTLYCMRWWQALVQAPCDLPCIAAGEVRTQALTVAADAALLQALAAVATTMVPPADFQLARLKISSRSATPGSSRRLRSTKKQPSILLSNAVVAFEVILIQAIILHTTNSVICAVKSLSCINSAICSYAMHNVSTSLVAATL